MLQRLIEFLLSNPVIAFLVLAWVAGAVGNAVKRAAKAGSAGPAAPRPPRPVRNLGPGDRSPEEVAAEMRRILGLDPADGDRPAAPTPPAPRAPVLAEVRRQVRAEVPVRVERTEGDREPSPVAPTTQRRRLDIHVDPHVGESMEHRHVGSRLGRREGLGELGGRHPSIARRRAEGHRIVDLTDLKRILVLSEVLGPPLALRDGGAGLQGNAAVWRGA